MRVTALLIACLLIVSLLAPLTLSSRAAHEPTEGRAAIRPGGDLTADELAALLGAYVWKFDVSLPADVKQVSVGLYQQARGKERVGFGAGISTPLMADTKRRVLIAIVPVGGSISEAEKARVTIVGFGMVASMTDDNPLRKLGIGGPVGSPEVVGDGTFNLIGGYEGGTISAPVSKADRIISLKIESQ
jgi:hypothetical protein